MARLVLCVLALCAAGSLADPINTVLPQKTADPVFLKKQVDLLELFYKIHEPIFNAERKTIANSWNIEKNIENFSNVTAVKIFADLIEVGLLPKSVPFSILYPEHRFEAVTIFNVLYSAKDYESFYKTAVALRNYVNEGLYVYVLSTAIFHRHDTQGIFIPNIYEVFPSFFFNGEIMTTAQRINTHGKSMVEYYPSTFVWNDAVVIRWNDTVWPYYVDDVTYWTHDHELNAFYYNNHLSYPFWLGGETVTLGKDKRGQLFWWVHRQLLAGYYMERLSNGFGEIPELSFDVVEQGYPGELVYHNGIPFPSRPNHYHLDQPHLVDELIKISDYERRIRDAIENGWFINSNGEKVNIRTQEAIDIVGNLIEGNVDSPNSYYYQDFITLWKGVLGNSYSYEHAVYYKNQVPMMLPSVLGHFQTSLRDPAFWMIWKRVMGLFKLWQKQLPLYKPEELALPSVVIQKVETDKLVTYFEHSYVNVTNHLFMDEQERKAGVDFTKVLVQRPQLNHKSFHVRVHVKNDIAKEVVVRFFLAPKYDSHGFEIPLHLNYENFLMIDQFNYQLPQGESVIDRNPADNFYTVEDWPSVYDVYDKTVEALSGKGQYFIDQSTKIFGVPKRFLLPKGRVGGMPFVLMVYISEYHAPQVPFGTGYDRAQSHGFGTGAVHMTSDPLGFPLNRPLWQWQIKDLHNLVLQDVQIYHKHTPEIYIRHLD